MSEPSPPNAFDDPDVTRCYARRPPYAPALFDFLLDKVDGRKRALDLGCGPGKIAVLLAGEFTEVVALDPAAAMIDAAREIHSERHLNIRWVRGAAEDLDAVQTFDLVTAGTSIHWMNHKVLFPRLAASTKTVAVITGDEPEHPPCGRGAWVDFLTRWLARVGRTYDPAMMDTNGRRFEPWMEIAGRETFAFTHRQGLQDFIAGQHSRATWARAAMGAEAAAEFDRDLERLLLPFVVDGVLELELQSHLTWGAPRRSLN